MTLGFSPCRSQYSGAKAQIYLALTARLKPCPDTNQSKTVADLARQLRRIATLTPRYQHYLL